VTTNTKILLTSLLLFVGTLLVLGWQQFTPYPDASSTPSPAPNSHLPKSTSKNAVRPICLNPLTIEVGHIDKQFEIGSQEILEVLQRAIKEWRDATGREWFKIETGGSLKVNFLFDGRQSDLLAMEKEQTQLEREAEAIKRNPNPSRSEVDSLLARIDSFRYRYEAAKNPVPWAQHHSDSGGTSIDVFAFSDREQLHATLLHELGHAMGLGHLPQQEAIMYALRIVQKSDIHLSQYDIEAALSLCEDR